MAITLPKGYIKMYPVDNYFKQNSIKNYSKPTFKIRLYDDTFEYTGKGFGSSNLDPFKRAGTFLGTKVGYGFYDYKNNFNNAEIGTTDATQKGSTLGLCPEKTDGTKLYFNVSYFEDGTWTSPILTPFYNATWDKCYITDNTNEDLLNPNLIFSENFENYEKVLSNFDLILQNNTGGTTYNVKNFAPWDYGLQNGYSFAIYGYNTFEYPLSSRLCLKNKNIFPNTFLNCGEVSLDFNILNGINISDLTGTATDVEVSNGGQTLLFLNSVAGNYILVTVGTVGNVTTWFGDSYAYVGTIAFNTTHNLNLAWNNSGTFIYWNAWLDGVKSSGTVSGTYALGTIKDAEICKLYTDVDITLPYLNVMMVDNFRLYNTRIHDNTWKGYRSAIGVKPDYRIKTSNDGTVWSDWYKFSSENTNKNSENYDFCFNIGTNTTGKFAQFQINFSGTAGTGTCSVTSFKPHCFKDISENEIMSISDIERKIDNNNKIGLIEGNDFNFTISNITGSFFGAEQQNKYDNPIFLNRPLLVNSPVSVVAGFGGTGTSGTQYAPVAYGYVTNYNLSPDNFNINFRASDPWTIYGDLQAGTSTGTKAIGSILQHFCDYNNISRSRQKIENISLSYEKIELSNSKKIPLQPSNGGWGDTWENTFLPGLTKRDNSYTSYNPWLCGQTYDGNYTTFWFPGVGWRRHTTAALEAENLKINDWPENNPGRSFCSGYLNNSSEFVYVLFQGNDKINVACTKGGNVTFNSTDASFTTGSALPVLASVWDNASFSGNGYCRILENVNGTAYMEDYYFNPYVSAGLTASGTTTKLGAFSPTAICLIPQPVKTANGTTAYYYLISGTESTGKKYIYKYLPGTGTCTSYIDKIEVFKSYQSLFYKKDENLLYVYGMDKVNQSYHYEGNFNSILKYDYAQSSINRIGIFGLKTQHSPFTLGTLFLNGTAQSGTFFKIEGTKGEIYFDNLYSNNDFFKISYTCPYIYATAPGTGATFKSAIQSLSNLALANSYFDASGNFVFKNKLSTTKTFSISTDGTRSYGNGLQENIISGNIYQDVNKIKNVITVIGTGTNRTTQPDVTSEAIYGTRIMSDYTNNYISTYADTCTYGTLLLNYMAFAKTYVTAKLPFHPEIEVSDGFDFIDTYNGMVANDAIVKSIKFDFKSFTTEISGETKTK
jgi:hypothetical protein